MIALLFLRLVAGLYAGMYAWWLAAADGVITAAERQGIWRSILLVEAHVVRIGCRLWAVVQRPL